MANADYVPIPEFYKNRSLFITGGTGFMGKVGVGLRLAFWGRPFVGFPRQFY
jgi:hypothetical protein